MTPEGIREQIDWKAPEKLHKELVNIYEQKTKLSKSIWNIFRNKNTQQQALSKESAHLGLLFMNCFKKYREESDQEYWSYSETISQSSKRFTVFQKLYDLDNLWEGEHYQLLVFFFGTERAPFVKKAWEQMPLFMYQTGYNRRSFRRPHHKFTSHVRQINFMINLINYDTIHPFSIKNHISHDNTITHYASEISHVWAAAIDEGNEDIYQHMTDILTGSAEVGTVSRRIIKALLLSNKPKAWEQVGNLLLAAQRQEGLRQVILECLDETSEGALQYMIDLVLEHNLIRFSSVIRALDTWAGFGWDAEKQSTVKRFMELAQKYYREPKLIETAIKNKDNAEVYMSLWGLGAHDIDKCYPYLTSLYEKGSIEKRTLALYFVSQSGLREWYKEFGYLAIEEENPQLLYWGIRLLSHVHNIEKAEGLFEKVFDIYEKFPKKEIPFLGKVFSWLTFTFKKVDIGSLLVKMTKDEKDARLERLLPLFDKMDISNREAITRKILPQFASYYGKEETSDVPSQKQRDFAFSILKDRSTYIRNTAMSALGKSELSAEEIQVFEGLLTRKSSDFRQYVLELIQKRPTDEMFASAERLTQAGNVEQRLAGLGLLNHLYLSEEHGNRIKGMAQAYAERKKIGRKEQILLDNLLQEKAIEYNTENGYGLYDVNNNTPVITPKTPTSGEFVKKQKGKHPFGLSMPLKKIEEQLNKLQSIYLDNKDYEYEIEHWDNSKGKVLLGNTFSQIKRETKDFTPSQHFENYPLYEKWDAWYQQSGLTSFDLFLIIFSDNVEKEDPYAKFGFKKTKKCLEGTMPVIDIPKIKENEYFYNRTIEQILEALQAYYPYAHQKEYLLGAARHVLSKIVPSELGICQEHKMHWQTQQTTVFDLHILNKYIRSIHSDYKTPALFEEYWKLIQFVHHNTPSNAYHSRLPSLQNYCKAYEQKLCTKDELMKRIIQSDAINLLTQKPSKGGRYESTEKILKQFPFVKELTEQARSRILEVELRRGDSSTPVTLLAQNIGSVYGIDYLIQILNGLGKDTLNRGYIYSYSNSEYSKKEVLSTLLKRCYPKPENTQNEFDKAIKAAKFSEKRLVEVGLYAQQWLTYITKYLSWKGLESGAWWLHAHTNSYHNAETETEIGRYSSIDMTNFRDGAVDYSWFQNCYKTLGKQRWKMLYDAAKYISDGTGHTRAKLYADVMTGTTKIREVAKRMKDKRNKDYVRVYGLVPLSKKTPDKDLLNRYNELLKFKKESRQFGAQRQASEGLAVKMAMENLARTAGYPDPIRLTWAMETEEAKSIIKQAETLQFDDVSIELKVDQLGKSSIICTRNDKKLKSIPAKFRKEKAVLELKDFHKRLKAQYSRSRKSLEEAMIRGDIFQTHEIQTLSEHPVIAPMLSALVLLNETGMGFYKDGKIVDTEGKKYNLGTEIRIAHCSDFYKVDNWTALQKYCFDNKVVQPFKQIFRELYVPTPDELQEKTVSRRYAGHQVQPKKTVALLKSRGWTVSYEEGLQKVYHKEGFIATIYAMADWFSPADVESPTLETVEFRDRKTYKNIAFEDMSPLIFSEVMRDVDLVVSVAHVGGVDPEASHSTVEMRAAIIRETARLFKLHNVEIKGHHAHIKGKYAEYSVHLGSAVTHQMPGKYLSILPIHSQHRGRLFLPFVDEDPRSAEVMSKILLLAKDKEIKDPTILSQIGV